nr:structural protein [Tolivirales sp.]
MPTRKSMPAPSQRSMAKAKPKNKQRRQGVIEVQKIEAPVASSEIILRRGQPIIRQPSVNMTFVSNSENVLSVAQAVAFGTTRVNLIPSAFPWLNNMATCFSKFRWKQLRLIYIPNCSTATNGLAVLSPGYDTGDAVPTTIQQAQQSFRAVSFPVWGGANGCDEPNRPSFASPPVGSAIVDLDVKRFNQAWYSYNPSTNPVTAGATRNTYVPCFMDLSTGAGSVLPVGIVMAKYQIEFIEPVAFGLNT